MKKLSTLSLGLALLSGLVMAEQQLPSASLQIYDMSNNMAKLMEGNKLSRSKARKLCIFLNNVSIEESNNITRLFRTPGPFQLSVNNSKTITSFDKKSVEVSNQLSKKEVMNGFQINGQYFECWIFDKKDPVGNYKLDLQFNQHTFKNLTFSVLK